MRKTLLFIVASLIVVLFGSVAAATPASAASYARAVYAPGTNGSTVTGWANINANCEGTYGCWTYIKVERLTTYGLMRQWNHIGGRWAGEGWQSASGPLAHGCHVYRTVVDSYNDSISNSVFGINLGVVQFSLGGGVKRYHKAYYSPQVTLCRWA